MFAHAELRAFYGRMRMHSIVCSSKVGTTASLAVSTDVCRDGPAVGVPGDLAGGADAVGAFGAWGLSRYGHETVVPGGCNGFRGWRKFPLAEPRRIWALCAGTCRIRVPAFLCC